MPKNDGGNAFPRQPNEQNQNWSEGMTLRDYFAAKAISGLCGSHSHRLHCAQEIAVLAYGFADAMLIERDK